MSVLSLISPVASIVRPMIGLGLLTTSIIIFKPLLTGILRALMLLITPKVKLAEVKIKNITGISLLNKMARDLESSQPNMAAELRQLACRE